MSADGVGLINDILAPKIPDDLISDDQIPATRLPANPELNPSQPIQSL